MSEKLCFFYISFLFICPKQSTTLMSSWWSLSPSLFNHLIN